MTEKTEQELKAEAIANKVGRAVSWPFRFTGRLLGYLYLLLLSFIYALVALVLGLPLRAAGFIFGCMMMHFRAGLIRAELTALHGAQGLRSRVDNAGQYDLAVHKEKGDA